MDNTRWKRCSFCGRSMPEYDDCDCSGQQSAQAHWLDKLIIQKRVVVTELKPLNIGLSSVPSSHELTRSQKQQAKFMAAVKGKGVIIKRGT